MHPLLTAINNFGKSVKTFKIIAGSLTCLLLSSCASNISSSPVETRNIDLGVEQVNERPENPINGVATPYVEQNNLNIERAEYFEGLADNQSNKITQQDSVLSAAEYYVQANDFRQAERAISELNTNGLSTQQESRYWVIQAYIAYSDGQYQTALQRLAPLTESHSTYSSDSNNLEQTTRRVVDQTQRVDALLLSSFCYQKLNDYDSAISSLIQRESLLVGNAKAETARYTWQVISNLSQRERQNIIQNTNDFWVRNRLEQSAQGQFATQTELPSQFDQWRNNSAYDDKQNIESQWNYTKAAHAVMDGIEHQHAANFSPYKPSIEFYDIGNDPYQANQYYTSVSGMGYDLVIGPIGKDYANQIFNSAAQSNTQFSGVSTLLLGGDSALRNQPFKLFSRLTMSPEAEGIEVANHAKHLGYVTAAVLAPDTTSGQRAGQQNNSLLT